MMTNIVTASNTVLEFLGVAGVWRFTSLSNSHLTPTFLYNPPLPSTPAKKTLCIGCLTPTASETIWTLLKWNTCIDPDRPNFPGWPLPWLQAAINKIGINWTRMRFISLFGYIPHIFWYSDWLDNNTQARSQRGGQAGMSPPRQVKKKFFFVI